MITQKVVLERRKYLDKIKTEELTEYTVWKFKEINLTGLRPCYKIFETGRFARTLLKDTGHHWNPCSCKSSDKIGLALHASREQQLSKSYTKVKKKLHIKTFLIKKSMHHFWTLLYFKTWGFVFFFKRVWVMSAVIIRHCSFPLGNSFFILEFLFLSALNRCLIYINRFSHFPLSIN